MSKRPYEDELNRNTANAPGPHLIVLSSQNPRFTPVRPKFDSTIEMPQLCPKGPESACTQETKISLKRFGFGALGLK
jgi:hypothetical protein